MKAVDKLQGNDFTKITISKVPYANNGIKKNFKGETLHIENYYFGGVLKGLKHGFGRYV